MSVFGRPKAPRSTPARSSRALVAVALLSLWGLDARAQTDAAVPMISTEESLKGRMAMSVSVETAITDVPQARLKAALETQLRDNGITVLPSGYPQLQLSLDVLVRYEGLGRFAGSRVLTTVYKITLLFVQAVALPDNPRAVAAATTWQTGEFGVINAVNSRNLHNTGTQLLGEFLEAHGGVNPNPAHKNLSGFELFVFNRSALVENVQLNPAQQKTVQEQISKLWQGPQLIHCIYRLTGGFQSVDSWYKTVPADIPQFLTTTPPGTHPMRFLGLKALETCPPTLAVARATRRNNMRPEDR
jgi:hypothetical protein